MEGIASTRGIVGLDTHLSTHRGFCSAPRGVGTHVLMGLDTHSCETMFVLCKFFSGGLTHLDLHHQLAVLSPEGAQALHAPELFTKFRGPGASHSVQTYGRPSPESR